jgi:hypothetical protein
MNNIYDHELIMLVTNDFLNYSFKSNFNILIF